MKRIWFIATWLPLAGLGLAFVVVSTWHIKAASGRKR